MKAILFDLDGVLVGTPKYGWVSDNKALQYFGVAMDETEHRCFEGMSLKLRIPMFEKKFNIRIDHEQFSRIFIETQLALVKDEIHENKKSIQNIIGILKEKGLKIAVVTSARKEKVDQILDWLGIENLLDVLLTSDDLSNHKPHPEPYLKALQALAVNPQDALVVEDSPKGIKSAKSAGIKVIALRTASFDKKDLKEADAIIHDLIEVLDY